MPAGFRVVLTVNKKKYELRHGIAFEGLWFDENVPMMLFCEKPIPVAQPQAAVKKGFDEQEMFFLKLGRYLLVRCTSSEKPTISGWADNLSFGSSGNVASNIEVSAQRVAGRVSMAKSETLGPFTYRYEVEFNLPLKELK